MKTYRISDINFVNSELYQKYLRDNPVIGYLKIRASAANSAVPISGLRVTVSKNIDNNYVIFFEGVTDSSGVIEGITLPVPRLSDSEMDAPMGNTYDISTVYDADNFKGNYKVNVYENVYVVQNINIIPKNLNVTGGF